MFAKMRFPRKSVWYFIFVCLTIIPGEGGREEARFNKYYEPAIFFHSAGSKNALSALRNWYLYLINDYCPHKTAARCYTVHRDTHHSSGNKQTRKMVDVLYLVDGPVAIDSWWPLPASPVSIMVMICGNHAVTSPCPATAH